jgi:hypothetical protein
MKWIDDVNVYAFDKDNMCRAQLVMEIDWSEHEAKLAVGKTTVVIDERWSNDTAIEVQEAVRLFNSFVTTKNLWTKWTVGYVPWVDDDYVDRQLGFETAPPVRWADSPEEVGFQIPELSELRVGCYLVTD